MATTTAPQPLRLPQLPSRKTTARNRRADLGWHWPGLRHCVPSPTLQSWKKRTVNWHTIPTAAG